ncbi:hypothetical protein [Lentzea sp. E54]|uniref:hypothetical protein n=1 Tax=Lentzea xerophila TaxID=3435883 RepID=UPI003DA20284
MMMVLIAGCSGAANDQRATTTASGTTTESTTFTTPAPEPTGSSVLPEPTTDRPVPTPTKQSGRAIEISGPTMDSYSPSTNWPYFVVWEGHETRLCHYLINRAVQNTSRVPLTIVNIQLANVTSGRSPFTIEATPPSHCVWGTFVSGCLGRTLQPMSDAAAPGGCVFGELAKPFRGTRFEVAVKVTAEAWCRSLEGTPCGRLAEKKVTPSEAKPVLVTWTWTTKVLTAEMTSCPPNPNYRCPTSQPTTTRPTATT